MELYITDNAAARINQLKILEQNPNMLLRISVDGGGCSGFRYDYEFVTKTNSDDYIAEKNGVQIVIDPVSQLYMDGATIDFIEQLGSAYFEIRNPKATAKCGCGNSFSM